jgi:hypothetical protein
MPKPKPRVLRKLVSGVHLFTNDASVTGLEITAAMPHDNWTMHTGDGSAVPNVAAWRSYFDTQGFNIEDLTFFPTNPQVQDFGPVLSDMVTVVVYDMFTVKPIADEDLEKIFALPMFDYFPPGSLGSNHDLQDIIFGQWRVYTISQTDAYNNIIQGASYGLNTPTGRDRIFVTRVVGVSAADGQYVQIPGCAFVLGGVTSEEKDLVHLERLRRNYDHSAQG